jgi:predicted ATP-dependent endonuclease of OLD family
MLKSLSIEQYKGFFEKETIKFAEPNNKNGSGLTLLVGPNNTGKTTVIEALLINQEKKFKESERHNSASPIITIESDAGISVYTNIDNGSQIKLTDGSKTHGKLFELIPSRRYWDTYSANIQNPSQFANASTQQNVRNAGGMETASTLKSINTNSELKKKFNRLLKIVMPHLTEWTIDSNDQNDYVKYMTPTASHQTNLLGDGVISIFRICAHLVADDKNRILIIDEPELSLHPTAQKALAKIISIASANRQVIVCTHSPHFANWNDLLNGAKFIRLNKPNDQKCTASVLDASKEYSKFISKNLLEYQKPQLLDSAAKEILFADSMLFVEGQEDVGLIRKWLYENNIDINFEIFAYGVGGYSNMKLFLQMASDLKLAKVAALYDSGVEDIYNNDKNEFSNFHFEMLPTDDIRDKVNSCKKCDDGSLIKTGCFDKSGTIKEDKKSAFEAIMNNIIDYFKIETV